MTLPRHEIERLSSIITERTGLTFPPSRQREMEEALVKALANARVGVDEIADVLDGDTDSRDELIASLTIGESYFFRDSGQFTLLRDELLPRLIATRGSAPLRLWSAGCAAGEEAYSLAILCREARIGERATVIGTDISRTRLAAARHGVYTRWALRGLDARTIDRYFIATGKRYALRPAYRGSVDFRYLNLAEDRYPSLATGIWGFDIILCRNVLIYFDRPTVARVAERLLDSLSEDGWLLLGAADPAISELVECEVVLTGAGLAYRRPGRGSGGILAVEPRSSPASDRTGHTEGGIPEAGKVPDLFPEAPEEVPLPEPPVPDDLSPEPATGISSARDPGDGDDTEAAAGDDVTGPVRKAYEKHEYAAAAKAAEALLRINPVAELHVLRVRSLANLGELERAGAAIDQALEGFRQSAELLYLHSVLLLEAGRWRDAAAAARRALYLDRGMVVAHIALAQALRRSGQIAPARRALRNAAELLAGLPSESTVPASDGERVGRLRTNVEAQLRLLEEVA